MGRLPASLFEYLSSAEREAAERWWAGLTDSARDELAVLLDPCAGSCSFALLQDEQGLCGWQRLPVIVDSNLLVEPDEPDIDWDADYFEYRMLNPERYPVPPYEYRSFHIGGIGTASRAWRPRVPTPAVQPVPNKVLQPIGARTLALRGIQPLQRVAAAEL